MEVLGLLVLLGAVNHQVAYIVTEGVIFKDFRYWAHVYGIKIGKPLFGYLFTCHTCFGMWVGFVEAVVTLGAVRFVHPVVDFFLVAFAAAFIGRVLNELIAVPRNYNRLLEMRVEREREALRQLQAHHEG